MARSLIIKTLAPGLVERGKIKEAMRSFIAQRPLE